MDQVLVKSDKFVGSKPKTPKYDDELKRRARELQDYKGER